jgi:hypothetical protein
MPLLKPRANFVLLLVLIVLFELRVVGLRLLEFHGGLLLALLADCLLALHLLALRSLAGNRAGGLRDGALHDGIVAIGAPPNLGSGRRGRRLSPSLLGKTSRSKEAGDDEHRGR